MFNINSKHFLFKQSSGRTINIFHKESAGICLSMLNKNGVWQPAASIAKNAVPEFSAYLDKNDGIHILHQDKNGSITYSYYDNSTWISTPITTGKNAVHQIRHLWVTGFDAFIYTFYTIEYPDSSFLYFQKGTIKGNLLEPYVIDNVESASSDISPAVDFNGNINIFYFQKSNIQIVPGYRAYDNFSSQWGSFVQYKEAAVGEKPGILSSCFDSRNNLHLLFNKPSEGGSELVHTVKLTDTATWQQEKCLAISALPFTNATLVLVCDLIIAYWVEENNIYYFISIDNNGSWSQRGIYEYLQGRQLYCISYSHNDPSGKSKESGLCLPGNYSSGYSLAFINDLQIASNLIKETTINSPEKDVKKLESNPQATEDHMAGYCSKPASYCTKLFTDMEKLDIRQTLLEAEINNIKKHLSIEKAKAEKAYKTEEKIKAAERSTPLMTGAGFSFVTPEYLKNIKK